jgi:uncharacterized protein YndB with AHSA1/START domain
MTTEMTTKPDYRAETAGKRAPRAAADGVGGTLIATVDVDAAPERVFDLFTSPEVERWWGHPEYYRWADWTCDLRVCGPWSVRVHLQAGGTVHGWGEIAAIEAPRKLVMTRRFDKHPLLEARETTITYRFEPIPTGTRVTVREEGFIGRSEAAYGNAEHWERVLAWLDAYVKA